MEIQSIKAGTTNQSNREAWLKKSLERIPPGFRILDAGAGERQYEKFCAHLRYVAQDFAQYDGQGNGKGLQTKTWDNSKVDIVSDITRIPVEDVSFDAVMCVEVFEHLPEPIAALKEFARILRPGGYLILTAPFCSLTHLAPHHYYSGFSRYFYEKFLPENGFEISELEANGNYFEYLAQETRRVPSLAKQVVGENMELLEKYALPMFLKMLERLSQKDSKTNDLLCYGFHVFAKKKKGASSLKYQAEGKFWKNEIQNYVQWYNSDIKELYQTPSPTLKQKVTTQASVEHNAILSWFDCHQKIKYLADLQLKSNVFKGKKVLDIGAGPMPSAEAFEESVSYCLDPLYLDYVDIGFPFNCYQPTTRFIPGCSEQMPFENHFFDAVISVNAIDHVDDFEKTVLEIQRVLKPNGLLRLHIHYHKKREAEPVELNDRVVKKAFEWCKGFKKISESDHKMGYKAQPGESFTLWSNF